MGKTRPVTGLRIVPGDRSKMEPATVQVVELKDLADYQAAVDGWIEAVALYLVPETNGVTMYVNEEFRYAFGPDDVNWLASDVASMGGRQDFLFSPILGPVVIVGPVDNDGYDTNLPEAAKAEVLLIAAEAGARFAEEVNS